MAVAVVMVMAGLIRVPVVMVVVGFVAEVVLAGAHTAEL